MTELEQFLHTVETFMMDNGMPPSTFGRLYAGDPQFVFQIRQGREPRLKTRAKVIAAMQADKAA